MSTTKKMTVWSVATTAALILSLVLVPVTSAIVAGAGFTTFDATVGGCKDSPNGINCNNYDAKIDVYMSGGPDHAGLTAGDYYFAVLTPGSQNGGFAEGANGNLSDTTTGGTTGDNGTGDPISCRTFSVSGHEIDPAYVSNSCAHAIGSQPNSSRFIIGLAPFDDTDNPGGVYILAICQVGAASPSQCKYDAFRIAEGDHHFGSISGTKYYDANADGILDNGEVGIPGWQINLTDSVNQTLPTDTNGNFTFSNLVQDTYTLKEIQATNQVCVTEIIGGVSTLVCSPAWIQSGNTQSQASSSNGQSTITLNNFVYTVNLADEDDVTGVNFGNVCVGAGGGLTIGFWSNKNGGKLITAGNDRLFLDGLNLRNADGSNFDPTTLAAFQKWLLNAKATNMAYMLSAQLAGMELNVRHGFVNGDALIYAPGTISANSSGFATVNAVMSEANNELGLHGLTKSGSPYRSYQEALKNALDRANNNLNFVQSGQSSCPTPTFPLP
jgi:hypothetical protein